MSLGGCLRMWLAILVAEIGLTLMLVPPAKIQALVEAELSDSRVLLGAADTDRVVEATNRSFEAVVGSVGSSAPRPPHIADSDEPVAQGMARASSVVIERVRGVVYLALYRLHWMRESILPLSLIAIAAAIDGLVVRRRRAYTFTSTSTSAYSAATYLVLSASFLPLFYLVAPVAVPAAALPLAGLAFAGAIWVLFAHLPGAGSIMGLRT